jgi:hypothetical protein
VRQVLTAVGALAALRHAARVVHGAVLVGRRR